MHTRVAEVRTDRLQPYRTIYTRQRRRARSTAATKLTVDFLPFVDELEDADRYQ